VGFIDNGRKAFGAGVPQPIQAAEIAAGMDTSTSLGPGSPLAPADGFSRTPRTYDYRSGYNISARPRHNERVSFDTLRGLVKAYDVAGLCISHRIASLRGLSWSIVAAEGIDEDVSRAIMIAKAVLRKPDGELTFKAWMAKYAYDVLAFDAGTLYKIRNNAGQPIGLRVVDGTTIAPLLDEYGNRPGRDPVTGVLAPAFVQYVQGVPWNWLTTDDLIYAPFQPTSDSPYGNAPLEMILLNANTDLRFQSYFLKRFTAGTVPEGFGIAPEGWTPQQIEAFQASWDAMLYGDEEAKSQIKWVPGGSSFEFPREQEFSSEFPKYLLQKTAAAFHVTPADLGFTEDVNRSTGDSQQSVQERIGDVPLGQHIAEVLTNFLQEDLGLPVEFKFDFGGEKEDRLQQAQADEIYMNRGVVSVSEIREERFGWAEAEGEKIPRFILAGPGPIPLSTLIAASAPVDAETGAPTIADVQPAQQLAIETVSAGAVAGAVQKGADDVMKAELGAFIRFSRKARQNGKWRDFTFKHVDQITGHRLNDRARATIRKDEGEVGVAGLAVRAADTGRVLMLQRALDPTDPAGGAWEFPGGHLEQGEYPLEAAQREWQEEVGVILPVGLVAGEWLTKNGFYAGYVWEVPDESCVRPHQGRDQVTNPDDPDGDSVEAVAWWDPADLIGNPAVRAELAAELSRTMKALHQHPAEEAGGQVDVPLAKASWRDSSDKVPQHRYDIALVDFYTPKIRVGLLAFLNSLGLEAVADRASKTVEKADGDERKKLLARITSYLGAGATADLEAALRQAYEDGYLAGDHGAAEQLDGAHVVAASAASLPATVTVDWSAWKPGNPGAAGLVAEGGLGVLLDNAGVTIQGIGESVLRQVGNMLADGITAGTPSNVVARTILEQVGSTRRAEMIAQTEIARAVTVSSLDTYARAGVDEWDLIVSDGACPTCLAIEAENPHPVDSLDNTVPVHPWCRCACAPRVTI
jgi:8-oxo-dGTP pyrophosphatase MutT (NUDIX family)